jgi:aspartyl-tRNA(Asn)/glutamyl-tRNA(Gln) amidotransferase subunit A
MTGEANPVVSAGIAGLNKLYKQRAISPVEALEAHLARIARLDPGINAMVHLDKAGARAAAKASSARWSAGAPLSPVDGAIIGVKANIAMAGLPFTAGVAARKDVIASADSTPVARLRAAGAIVIGLLNMHEAALGAVNDGPLYGKCWNPLRPGYTPGGSSGGSAAAVAAGFVSGALGTDTMGSVRIPSSYCGIAGFKPGFGRISRHGVALLSWSLDHVGVHARTIADLDRLSAALYGLDGADPHSIEAPKENKPKSLQGMRIGRVRFDGQVDVARDIVAAFEDGLDHLRQAGVEIVDVTLDGVDLSVLRRRALLISEAEGAIMFAKERREDPDGLSHTLRDMLSFGAKQTSEKLAEAYWALEEARRAVRKAFQTCEAFVLPTAPQCAFAHGEAAPANQADLTVLANVAGLPAVTAPMTMREGALPAGIQIMTPPLRDRLALSIAAALEA